jgi:uncharacterized coiled-coil protein SlyX
MPSQKARQSQEQLESTSTTAAKTSKRTSRTTNGTQAEGKNADPATANATGWEKVLEVVGMTHKEVRKLTQIVAQQQETIKNLEKRLEETQQEVRDVKVQMDELNHQLDEIKNNQATASPRGSYADVARTPPTSQPSNVHTLSSINTTPSSFSGTLFCTIDTSRVEDMERDKTTAGTIRAMLEQAIRTMKDHGNWRCRAVTVDPKKENRIKIACRDEAEHQLVKRVAEANVAGGVRVLRDDLYPIKVDSVRRTAVLDENDEIRVEAAEGFGQENETTVAKIAWLSKKEAPKAYGSMVVYLTKEADARRLLAEGFFHAGGESGYTGVFERRPRPDQCYRCQEVGHKAFQCNKAQVCGRCAKEGHHHSGCSEPIVKCVLCGGPHESFSRNCKKLYPSQHE